MVVVFTAAKIGNAEERLVEIGCVDVVGRGGGHGTWMEISMVYGVMSK